MGIILGITLSIGILLVYAAVVDYRILDYRPFQTTLRRFRTTLLKAGLNARQRRIFVAFTGIFPLLVGITVYNLTKVLPVAVAVTAAVLPLAPGWLRARLASRRQLIASAWPDITDSLLTAVRAGVSLPEAVVQLAVLGPEVTRPFFVAFAADYRSCGRFDEALERLQVNLADPAADRVIEIIRLSRQLGGNEMGNILRDLSAMMRENLRITGEIEARQSWIVNAARLAVAAPWVVLLLISLRTDAGKAYSTSTGMMVLACGGIACTFAYWLMQRLGRIHYGQEAY